MKPGQTNYIALHRKVLVVAHGRHDGWCAYILPVAGNNHDEEQHNWPDEGCKLPERWARPMFGYLENQPYAH